MKTNFSKLIATFFVAALSFGFVACGGDDEEDLLKAIAGAASAAGTADNPQTPDDPEGTITVNIRNANNGGDDYVSIGIGSIKIDGADNFIEADFVSLGKVNGLSAIKKVPVSGWARKVAVVPGYGYVVRKGDNFARLYVVDYMYSTGGGIIGAIVKYQSPWDIEIAVTGKAGEVGSNYAVISGIVNMDKISATLSDMEFGVEFWTNSSVTSKRHRKMVSNPMGNEFSVRLNDLAFFTTYYYRTYVYIPSLSWNLYGSTETFTSADISGKSVNLCPNNNHPHAIDMGEAGIWACCNVGASKPEEYGSYFAWGETETKSDYSFETYKHKHGNSYIQIGSNIGGSSTYDAATKNWGSSWRMPSKDQIDKIIQNCVSERTRINGVLGWLFTASNGNSIFLPAAGCSDEGVGSEGNYWSSSSYTTEPGYPYGAYDLFFNSEDVFLSGHYRVKGLTVRPVRK